MKFFSRKLKNNLNKPEINLYNKKKFDLALSQWHADKGDLTHRLDYFLDKDSLVFDLGGYEGWFAARIFCKYCCNVIIFEPYVEYVDQMHNRFLHNKKIKIFPFGLAEQTQNAMLNIDNYSSSMYIKSTNSVNVKLIKASIFFSEHNIQFVDVMKINIEGGEYDLLEHLIESGLIFKIKNLQIQFHFFVPNASIRMDKIQAKLEESHILTYQYYFVWENWQLKSEKNS